VGPESLPFTLPVALGGIDFLRARLFTCHWHNTTLGNHSFQAYMAPWDVFKLRLLHYTALLISFGLLWPWVKIHNYRYTLESIDLATLSSLDDLTSTASTQHSGTVGDSVTDFLDIEIGL
jgi:uncharacterized membrane protein YjgN (DUF898 family)